MPPKRVAIVQAEVAPDLRSGLELTTNLATEAARDGAELVVFPETWLPGYPAWLDFCRDAALWDHAPVKEIFARLAANSVVVEGESGQALGRIAAGAKATLIVGVSERVAHGPGRGTLYNTILTYGPDGALLNHHRKLVPTYTERLLWGAGDAAGLRAVDTPAGRVGALVCWEHWMPLTRQALHESGEDIHVALWPAVNEMHQLASRHYALEGRCFVLAAGALMRTTALPPALEPHAGRLAASGGEWVLRGGSAILAPDGTYVAGPFYKQARTLHAELDLARIFEEAMTLDVTGHYHRPDCFRFVTRRGPRAPDGRPVPASSARSPLPEPMPGDPDAPLLPAAASSPP